MPQNTPCEEVLTMRVFSSQFRKAQPLHSYESRQLQDCNRMKHGLHAEFASLEARV